MKARSSRSRQASLFDDITEAPIPADVPTQRVLQAALAQTPPESAAHRRLRVAMQEIDTLTQRITELKALDDSARQRFMQVLGPLEQTLMHAQRELVMWLDARSLQPKLSKRQRETLSAIILALAGECAVGGDPELQALFTRHLNVLAELHGRAPSDTANDDAEKLSFHEAMARANDDTDPEFDAWQRAAAAPPRKSKKPSAAAQRKAQQAAALAQDANQALRSVYRQLASALHPDREADPTLAAEKTALMKDANQAYAARDLPALLQLMLKADLIDMAGMAELANERAQALDALFTEQIQTLRTQCQQLEQQLRDALGLGFFGALNEKSIKQQLARVRDGLTAEIQATQSELRSIRGSDVAFKQWLKTQS
ncbi:MAG: J domain-containing protein [Rhodoferax sp.]